MNNGKGQSPCVVAAWEQEACASTPWTIIALTAYDNRYVPPNTTTANACTCSWASYNLIAACTVCQNSDDFLPWGEWQMSCGTYVSNTTYFPSDKDITLPSETAIPYWAGTDPQTWDNAVFDWQQAQSIHNEDRADLTGAPIPTTSMTSSKKSNTGAIVGGVVGGVALVLLAVAFFIWGIVQKRKRLRQQQKTYPGGPDRPDMQHMRSMSDSSQKYLDPNGYGMPPGLHVSPLMLPMANGAQPMSHPLQNLSSPVAQSITLPMPQINGMAQVPGVFPTGGIVTHAPAPSTSPVQRHMPSPSTQSIGGVMSSVGHNAPPGGGVPAAVSPTSPEDVISPFITPPTSPQPTSRKGTAGGASYDFFEDLPSPSKSPASSVSAQRRMNPPAYTSDPVSGEVQAVAPTPGDRKHEYRKGVSPEENNQDGTGVGTGVATYGSPLEERSPIRWEGSTATPSDAGVSVYPNDSKQRPMDSFSDVMTGV